MCGNGGRDGGDVGRFHYYRAGALVAAVVYTVARHRVARAADWGTEILKKYV